MLFKALELKVIFQFSYKKKTVGLKEVFAPAIPQTNLRNIKFNSFIMKALAAARNLLTKAINLAFEMGSDVFGS